MAKLKMVYFDCVPGPRAWKKKGKPDWTRFAGEAGKKVQLFFDDIKPATRRQMRAIVNIARKGICVRQIILTERNKQR